MSAESTGIIRVLWLEDCEPDVEILSRLLRQSGMKFEITLAADGEQFRDKLSPDFDIILADYHLPDIKGPEALAIAQLEVPEVPVIFVSGSIGEERAIAAIREGAVDYILKDRPSRLPSAILRAVQDRKDRETARRLKFEEEERFRRQFEQSPVAKFVWKVSGDDFRFVDFNAAADRLSRGLASGRLGSLASEDYRDHPELIEAMHRCARERGSAHLQIAFRRPEGVFNTDITIGFIDPDLLLFYIEDVTAFTRAQEQLEFQAALLSDVRNAIIATDIEARVTYWNSYAEELFGWSAEEVMGRNLLDFHVPPELVDFTRGLLNNLRQTGRFEGEMAAVRKDDRIIPVFASITTIPDAPGGKSEYVAVYFDLSELKREQDARLKNERLLAGALESLPTGVRITDAYGRTIQANPAARMIWGHVPNERLSDNGTFVARWGDTGELIGPNDWPLDRALRTRSPVPAREIEVVTPSGERRTVLHSAIPIIGSAGVVQAGVVVSLDITEVRMATRAIEKSEERFRSLVENLSDVISVLDSDGTMLYQSMSVTRALGYLPDELVGGNISSYLRPSEAAAAATHLAKQINSPTESSTVTIDFRHKDGRWRTLHVTTKGIYEDGQLRVVAVARDVSEQRIMAGKLAQAERITGLGRVAATIAHEINNVLMGILPFAEVIRLKAGGDESLQVASSQIARAMRRGKRITQEILRFSQAGEATLAPINLGEFLTAFEEEAKTLVGPARSFLTDCDDSDFWVNADPEQFSQMLSNLIINARDATPPGTGRVELECRTVAEDEVFPFAALERPAAAYIHLIVRDNGTGISPEVASRAFDPLFTTKSHGTGLGLSVVHQIVDAHRGEIFIESSEGEGSAFHIFLPKVDAPSAGSQEKPGVPAEEKKPIEVRRILLVDDDDAVVLGLTMLLELEGFLVSAVGEARAVIPEIESFRPDLVILDFGLPDATGLDVFRQIQPLWPNLPVVFSTGEGDAGLVEVQSARNVGYLLKPYDIGQLLEEIRRVTSQRH